MTTNKQKVLYILDKNIPIQTQKNKLKQLKIQKLLIKNATINLEGNKNGKNNQ